MKENKRAHLKDTTALRMEAAAVAGELSCLESSLPSLHCYSLNAVSFVGIAKIKINMVIKFNWLKAHTFKNNVAVKHVV